MLTIICILGIVEVIYGLFVLLSIISPYSIRVSLNNKNKNNWNKYHGIDRICWGFAFIFFSLWGLKIGYSTLNITLAIAGIVFALIASFKIKS